MLSNNGMTPLKWARHLMRNAQEKSFFANAFSQRKSITSLANLRRYYIKTGYKHTMGIRGDIIHYHDALIINQNEGGNHHNE